MPNGVNQHNESQAAGVKNPFVAVSEFRLPIPMPRKALCLLVTLLWALDLHPESVSLGWDPNTEPDLAGYRFYFKELFRQESPAVELGNVVRHTVNGLSPGKTYGFRVSAVNKEGVEGPPSSQMYWLVPVEPEAKAFQNSIALWLTTLDAGGVGYLIKRSTSPEGPFQVVATNTTTYFLDTSVVGGQEYYYKVSVQTVAAQTRDSKMVNAKPGSFPSNFVANRKANGVRLRWDAFPGAKGYVLVRSASATGLLKTISSQVSDTTFIDNTTTIGREYFYSVAAVLADGTSSAYSPVTSVIVLPEAPTAFQASLFAARVARITWETLDFLASGFLLSISTSNSPTTVQLAVEPEKRELLLPGLEPGLSYRFELSATNAFGPSDPAPAVTLSMPVAGFNIRFGPSAPASTLPGYMEDDGHLLENSTQTPRYGWNVSKQTSAFGQSGSNLPDGRYASWIEMNQGESWEIEIPDGSYLVNVVAGGPAPASAAQISYQAMLEGIPTQISRPRPEFPWVQFSKELFVSDGRLSVGCGPSSSNLPLSFIEIYSVPSKRPRFGTHPVSQTGVLASNLVLTASLMEGTEPVSWQWFFGSNLLPGENSPTLVLSNLTTALAGTYHLVASNAHGSASSEAALVQVRPPNAPPTIDPIQSRAIDSLGPPIEIVLTGISTGPPGEGQQASITASHSNPGAVSKIEVLYTPPSSNAVLRITPVSGASGIATIKVIVNDGGQEFSQAIRHCTVSVETTTASGFLLEAEHGYYSQSLAAMDDKLASGGGKLGSVGKGSFVCRLPFYIRKQSRYFIWCRILFMDSGSQTVEFRPEPGVLPAGLGPYRNPRSVWIWKRLVDQETVEPRTYSFNEGGHVLLVSGLESNIQLDAFYVVEDPNFLPPGAASNKAPTITALEELVLPENSQRQTIQLSGISSGSINESQRLEVRALSSRPDLIPNPVVSYLSPSATGSLTFTPVRNSTGSALISVLVDDGGSANPIAKTQFLVTLFSNAPPRLSSIPSQRTTKGFQPADVSFVVSDRETPAEALLVSALSSDPGLIPPQNLILSGVDSNRVLRIIPLPNSTGSSTITISVTDEKGARTATNFLFSVLDSNTPPILLGVRDVDLMEDTPSGPLILVAGDVESPPEAFTLTAFSSDQTLIPRSGLILSGSGHERMLQIIPATNRSGIAKITLTLSDGGRSGTLTTNLTVMVEAVNDPPTLDPISDLTIAEGTAIRQVQLTGITSGPFETQPVFLRAVSADKSVLADPLIDHTNNARTATLTLGPFNKPAQRMPVDVIVSDGGSVNGTTSRRFFVTINATNSRPVIQPIEPQQTLEDTPIDIPFTVTDAEDPISQITATVGASTKTLFPDGSLFIFGKGTNRVIRAIPAAAQSGTALLTLNVSDGRLTSRLSFSLQILAVNDPPTLNPLPDLGLISTNSRMTYTVNFTGVTAGPPNEPSSVVITASSGNTNLLPVPTRRFPTAAQTGSLTLQPVSGMSGSSEVSIAVSDSDTNRLTAQQQFTVFISPPTNSLPTLTTQSSIQASPDGLFEQIPIMVTDAETPAERLQLKAKSSNPVILPDSAILLGGSGTNRTISLNPARIRTGAASIFLTLVDESYGAVVASIQLQAVIPNQPPVLQPVPDQTLLEDSQELLIPIFADDSDSPLTNLVLSASSDNTLLFPEGSMAIHGSGTVHELRLKPSPDVHGSALFTLTLGDGQTNSVRTFRVAVLPVNDPPSISTASSLVMNEDDPGTLLTIQHEDPDTEPGQIKLSARSLDDKLIPPGNLRFGDDVPNRTLSVRPAQGASGSTIVQLIADDGQLQSTNQIEVTVLPVNDPPTVNPLPNLLILQSEHSKSVLLGGVSPGADEAGDPLVIVSSSSNPSLIPHPVPGPIKPDGTVELVLEPVPGRSGVATISVTLNDGRPTNGIVTRTFLAKVNSTPEINPLNDLIIQEDQPVEDISVAITDADSPADSLMLRAVSSNPAVVANPGLVLTGTGGQRRLSIFPAKNASGSTRIAISASDPDGDVFTTDFILTVLPFNDPPTLDPIPDVQAGPDASWIQVPLTGLSSGASDENQTLSISAQSGDSTLVSVPSIEYQSPDSTAVLFLNPVAGTTGSTFVTVTVMDHREGTVEGINRFSRTFKVERSSQPVSPEMRVESVAEGILISWDATQGANFVLQTAPALAEPQVWTRTNLSPVLTNGRYQLVIPISTQAAFFRLCASCVDQ